MARKRLGEILIQAGVLDEGKLRAALNEQRRWGGPLGRILVDMKLVSEDAMVQALSQQLNFPTVTLEQLRIRNEVLDLLPAELAEQHSAIPFNVQGKFLDVAMADPTNLGIIDELRIRTRLNVRPYLAGPKAIERALAKHYGRGVATLELSYGPEVPEPPIRRGERMIQIDTDPGRHGGPGMQLPTPTTDEAFSSAASPAAARRAQQFEFMKATPPPPGAASTAAALDAERAREIAVLQARVQHLEALVARDEEVLRKLLTLLIEKGVASREEILDKIR
jgi:type IV pilus assembly protein PilB